MLANDEENDADSDILSMREMGYKQELYRGVSALMSFSFCFTAVSVLTSISISFNYGLNVGGSAVMIWGWIIGFFFTVLICLSLAEICSTYPSAGSVYHCRFDLYLASFMCGWFNFLGNAAGDAAFSSGFASILNAAVILNGETNSTTDQLLDKGEHRTGLSINIQVAIGIGMLAIWALQNALRIDQQGWLNNIAAVLQVSSVITIIITILAMAKNHASLHDIFFTTYNSTGFSFGYVCCIGILFTLFSFSGYEASAHLSEETRGAAKAAPLGIIGTTICAGIIGFIYLFTLLFAITPSVKYFVEHSYNENLAVQVYELSVPKLGALALTVLLLINIYFAGASSITVTSRIGFAMARDGVFPGSHYLRWIYQRTLTPLANILFIFIIDSLFILLQLASPKAFTAILSITTIGLQVSYLIPIVLRITYGRRTFKLGQFNLGRYGGIVTGTLSSIWLFVTSIFMFFPTNYPVTVDNMNWAIVVVAGVTLIAAVYWLLSARYWFIGPKRTVDDPQQELNSLVK
ncbi:unnamed protein product [Didymodactylos carnosus]|uniref:Amino acid transporter n=1 Tax=Didymodactylos carnosus TaxID=1234261 RepID=A0A814WCQ6_9BILA|nr:unnamed protein product [Didymodactylos carnosus]CAF1199609.1 unnamed protein product [Didymodactylos carnosus]CAF3605903.1 unnamed protein product [Didymodactylos carnosus]CAF3964211.1 unnamed protein product [Didymodactylos carnosus]